MNGERTALYDFTKGIIKENPVLVTLLGMCPTLAVTVLAVNGIGMGLATTFVLVCSNLVISLLKNVIPKAAGTSFGSWGVFTAYHRKLHNPWQGRGVCQQK